MSKFATFAEALTDFNKELDDEADKLAADLARLKADAPGAISRGRNFIAQKRSEIGTIDNAINRLSNLPLEESDVSTTNSGG